MLPIQPNFLFIRVFLWRVWLSKFFPATQNCKLFTMVDCGLQWVWGMGRWGIAAQQESQLLFFPGPLHREGRTAISNILFPESLPLRSVCAGNYIIAEFGHTDPKCTPIPAFALWPHLLNHICMLSPLLRVIFRTFLQHILCLQVIYQC